MKKYIPNALSIMRFFLGIAFPFVPASWRLPVLVVAAFSEAADGYLSRRWDVVSQSGKILDAVADKVFVFAMVATFFYEGYVQVWELVFVGLRDIVVFAGASWIWAFGDRTEFERARPRPLGKITTNFQFAFLLVALLWSDVPLVLVLVTGVFSFAAAVDYVLFYLRDVRQPSPANF